MTCMYKGIPSVMLNGKVMARAMGKYKLGLALGAAMRMAAGTAIYDALAARMESKKRSPSWVKKKPDNLAMMTPLMMGITMANSSANQPLLKSAPISVSYTHLTLPTTPYV